MVFELFDRRTLSGSASTCAQRAARAGKNRGLVAPCPHTRARSGLPGSARDLVWYLGCFASKRGTAFEGATDCTVATNTHNAGTQIQTERSMPEQMTNGMDESSFPV